MIPKNLHNPIPLHDSMDKWYDKKPTYKGSVYYVAAPNGYLLPMQLTLQEEDVSNMQITMSFYQSAETETMCMASAVSSNRISYVGENYSIYATQIGDGKYNVSLSGDGLAEQLSCDGTDAGKVFTEKELRKQSHIWYKSGSTESERVVNVSGGLLSCFKTLGAVLVSMDTCGNTDVELSTYIDLLPISQITTQKRATMYLGGCKIVSGMPDGKYYLKITIGGREYYTEPFMWLSDMSKYIHITYRRNQPIYTAKNVIPFAQCGNVKYMEMYIGTIFAKPPHKYEEEIKTEDGYKFVQKQVSYVDEQFRFQCSGYFAEALRMLWHCNRRVYSQFGEQNEVDYMEAPVVNWDLGNHLCECTIEFQSDTITQSNGVADMRVATSENDSFGDQPFDASFN